MTISPFKSRCVAACGVVALLAGCQQAPETQNTATPTPVATPTLVGVRALPEDEQLKRAFRTAYGSDDSARIGDGDNDTVVVKPGKLLWVEDTAVLMAPGANASDCHVCSGAVAITYLKPKADGFEVTGKWPTLVRGTGWGAEPDWKVTDAYTPYPAIYVEAGWSGQGYSCESAIITELKPDAPVQSAPIRLSSSNEGAVDPDTGKTMGGEPLSDLAGTISDVVKGKSIAVQASGTAKFVERYEYRGGKFVPLQKESRLSC